MHDKGRALDMAKELVTQTLAFMSTLDEAGNVSDDEAGVVACANNAKIRDERGEGIVSDLRTSSRDLGDQRAFARRRHADQSSVGHKLHLELDPALLSRFAKLCESRSATGRRDEMDVATTANAARHHRDTLAVMREVGDKLAGFLGFLTVLAHNRANGNLQYQVLARGTMHTAAPSMGAALGFEMMLEAILDKRRDAAVGFNDHVSAVTAVAAVGTALRHMSFSAEGHAARAAVARFHMDMNLVYELRCHVVP